MNTRKSDTTTKDNEIDDGLRTWLKASLQTVENNMKQHFDDKYKTLTEKVDANTTETAKILQLAQSNKENVEKVTSDLAKTTVSLNEQTVRVDDLQNCIDVQAIQIRTLQQRLENQTNRNSRKSVIIRGIPEEEEEKTWDDTRKVVCETLADVLGQANVDWQVISRKIERVHRGRPLKEGKRGPRVVHALFYDWNDSEKLKLDFLKLGRNNQNIFVEQRYGPDTDYRRHKAKEKRKQLIEQGTIEKAYVRYPAKLMVKRPGDRFYSMLEDFSGISVPLDVSARTAGDDA